ncbi:MAG: VOC family protein [Proteobacteria bacterium]|nr:VOC family protein [Pseudomonadota bacterium]
MLDIKSINHIGIRVRDKSRSMDFYEVLGFQLIQDAGFDKGHPVIMQHPSGVVVNLLGMALAIDVDPHRPHLEWVIVEPDLESLGKVVGLARDVVRQLLERRQ